MVSNYEKTIEINLLKIEGEIGSGKNKCGRVKHTAFFLHQEKSFRIIYVSLTLTLYLLGILGEMLSFFLLSCRRDTERYSMFV